MNLLEFHKIKKDNIFTKDFDDFTTNNKLNFSNDGICVIYAPNGVGKTSFSKVLAREKNTELQVEYNSTDASELFYVISDQNARHIIQGKTEEFLLGDNIKKEFELKEEINKYIKEIFEVKLPNMLKDTFNISKVKSDLLNIIVDKELKDYISQLANKSSRGAKINIEKFTEKIKSLSEITIDGYSEPKFNYFINDLDKKDSIIRCIQKIIANDIRENEKIEEIEENTAAIDILTRFPKRKQCIVCDNKDVPENLLEQKAENKEKVFEQLNETEKYILKEILDKIQFDDPFFIKDKLKNALRKGNKNILFELKEEFEKYETIFNNRINNLFKNNSLDQNIIEKIETFYSMIKVKPKISDEDILYIKEIINNSISRDITLVRDDGNNLKLLLNESEFIGVDREELHLSTGEQNFISLTFELLKAKNNDKQIIVLDDPISSFDSIYKNKIVYSIVKFLESKKQIILTHNTDLIRLLQVQRKNCFTLYLLNNVDGQENGFIEVKDSEKNILIFLPDLLDFIRNDINSFIENEREYVISIIPFMRGYANFIGDTQSKNLLTQVMHGYCTEKINITQIYNRLFKKSLTNVYELSVQDILNIDIKNLCNILTSEYPILNKTLKHSFSYLYLRLLVEKSLVKKYNINTKNYDNLGSIIFQAYKGNEQNSIIKRVFLTSKKTLLNEFNHFEGNMSIFQPAIDISDYALEKEKQEIIEFITKEVNE